MLILSFQFTLTIIICFLYVRLTPIISIAHRLLNNLNFVLLAKQEDQVTDKKKSKKKLVTEQKDYEIRLHTIEDNTLNTLFFYEEYDQLVLMLICLILNFGFYEIWTCITNEKNGMVTAILVFAGCFALKVLLSLVLRIGMQSQELRLTLLAASISFFFAYMFIELPSSALDIHLKQGFWEFSNNISELLGNNHFEMSKRYDYEYTLFKMAICIISAFIAGVMFFPSFRVARTQYELLKFGNSRTSSILYATTILLSLLALILWVPWLSRNFLVGNPYLPWLTSDIYEVFRIYVVIFIALLRILLLRTSLQSFLFSALGFIQSIVSLPNQSEQAKRISADYKAKSILAYSCVVAVQLIAPCILLLSFAFVLKIKGFDYISLTSMCNESLVVPQISTTALPDTLAAFLKSNMVIFTSSFYRGLFSYLTWWTLFCSFFLTVLALFYEYDNPIYHNSIIFRNQKTE